MIEDLSEEEVNGEDGEDVLKCHQGGQNSENSTSTSPSKAPTVKSNKNRGTKRDHPSTSRLQENTVSSSQDFTADTDSSAEETGDTRAKKLKLVEHRAEKQLMFRGGYFTLNLEQSDENGKSLSAFCNNCPKTSKPIRGSITTATNWLKHLQVLLFFY